MSQPKQKKQTKGRSRRSETKFPGRLHDLLEYVESENLDHIVSWVKDGTAFQVHMQDEMLQLLSIFFGQTQYRSFTRQLISWHFKRLQNGTFKGAFFHPYFQKGDKTLCAKMSQRGPPNEPEDEEKLAESGDNEATTKGSASLKHYPPTPICVDHKKQQTGEHDKNNGLIQIILPLQRSWEAPRTIKRKKEQAAPIGNVNVSSLEPPETGAMVSAAEKRSAFTHPALSSHNEEKETGRFGMITELLPRLKPLQEPWKLPVAIWYKEQAPCGDFWSFNASSLGPSSATVNLPQLPTGSEFAQASMQRSELPLRHQAISLDDSLLLEPVPIRERGDFAEPSAHHYFNSNLNISRQQHPRLRPPSATPADDEDDLYLFRLFAEKE